MASRVDSRFDAEAVVRTATLTEPRRLEIVLTDSHGERHVVTLPLAAALDLACLVNDVSENTPYLIGGLRRRR